MNIKFERLSNPTTEFIGCLNRWQNDPIIVPFIRLSKNKDDLESRKVITTEDLEKRLQDHFIYLIYLQDLLIGEIEYQIDPKHLYKKETGTAWIGILIGEEIGRGKGIGYLAFQYLEGQIKLQGLRRIELGVFEFNTNAIKLYQRLGYKEIARINDVTFWQDKLWQDIRMEKYL